MHIQRKSQSLSFFVLVWEKHGFLGLFYFNIVKYQSFKSHLITTKKVTRLRVKISKSRIKSILMVFAFGLRQIHLFGSFFSSTLFITINGVISIFFDSYIITIIKVTRLRVRISKFRIKSIFMVFPSGLRVTRLFRLILLQHCLLLSMVSSKSVSYTHLTLPTILLV